MLQAAVLSTTNDNVTFHYQAGQVLVSSFTLQSLVTEGCCAAFKVKTNAPQSYTVSRSRGVIESGHQILVKVYMHMEETPSVEPHAFLVQVI